MEKNLYYSTKFYIKKIYLKKTSKTKKIKITSGINFLLLPAPYTTRNLVFSDGI